VVVIARSKGYIPRSASSLGTDRAKLGTIRIDKPTISGRHLLGETLTAHVTSPAPATAVAHYRWFRGAEPIRGAHDATYVLTADDLRHHVWVQVTMRAENWIPVTRRSVEVTGIRTVPVVHAHARIRSDGRVVLRVRVEAPGYAAPDGVARVFLGSQRVGRIDVTDGVGSHLLQAMRHGTHTLTVVFRGDASRMTAGRSTVSVTVP
jgi:hypothetical protein